MDDRFDDVAPHPAPIDAYPHRKAPVSAIQASVASVTAGTRLSNTDCLRSESDVFASTRRHSASAWCISRAILQGFWY